MKRLTKIFAVLAVVTSLLVIVSSCRTIKYVPIETTKTEYKVRDRIKYDSVYQHDSVYVIIKGDTLYEYRDRYVLRYVFVNKTDTIISVDSISVPVIVEKQLSKWEKAKIELGGLAFGAIFVLLVIILLYICVYQKKKGGFME